MSLEEITPLTHMAPGEVGIVAGLAGGRGLVGRLAALGLTPGGEVTVVQNYGHGPLIVRIRDTRIALGRGEAFRIKVRKSIKKGSELDQQGQSHHRRSRRTTQRRKIDRF